MPEKQSSFLKTLAFGEKGKNLALLCLILIPNTIAALCEGLSFGFILLAFKSLNHKIALPASFFPTSFIAWFDALDTQTGFILFLLLAIFSQILRSSSAYLGRIAIMFLGTRVQVEAQIKVYQQILRLSFPCASRYKSGDLLEYAKIPSTLINYLLDPLNQLIVSAFMIATAFCIMLFLSTPLTLLAIAMFGAFMLLQKVIIAKISRIARTFSELMVDLSKHTVQSLQALRTIHTFNRQKAVMKQTLGNLTDIAKISKKLNLWSHSTLPINETAGIMLVGLFLVLGKWFFASKTGDTLPILLTFIMIIHRLNSRMQLLVEGATTIARHWGYIVRLEEIFDEKDKEFCSNGTIPLRSFDRAIELCDVHLQYEGAAEPVIQNLNLTISKGHTTALIGASGAGKSSILDLILKLYEPSKGAIKIDAIDLSHLEIGSWRNRLGVVSQDTFIFNETIEENIRFGLLEATMDRVVTAARAAGAHEFISLLPQEYQTVVGEKGYRLSGGERQRIALARALIRNPEVLILDEATSNLDSLSEHRIQQALQQLQGQKTILIIAHRLSTIAHADHIFVLDKGQIVEMGSHEDLLKQQGKYAFFWSLQSKSGK